MDDNIPASTPSISSGAVGSRFVSQSELDTAKARRDEQWKAAYARLGQEPPPQPVDDAFDGRSLAEKLAANRAAKQEEWEERNKLGNQFRALEEDEVLFLDSLAEKQREEERLRKELEGEQLKSFRQAVAARESAAKPPPVVAESSAAAAPAPSKAKAAASASIKRDTKKSLKGVLVKKKSKAADKSPPAATSKSDTKPGKADTETQGKTDDPDKPPAKRRKVDSSS